MKKITYCRGTGRETQNNFCLFVVFHCVLWIKKESEAGKGNAVMDHFPGIQRYPCRWPCLPASLVTSIFSKNWDESRRWRLEVIIVPRGRAGAEIMRTLVRNRNMFLVSSVSRLSCTAWGNCLVPWGTVSLLTRKMMMMPGIRIIWVYLYWAENRENPNSASQGSHGAVFDHGAGPEIMWSSSNV